MLGIQGSAKSGKTLRTNYNQNLLFINLNDEMLMFGYIYDGDLTSINYVNRGRGGAITDFQILPFNRVLILTQDGYLNLWEFEGIIASAGANPILLNWHRLSKDRASQIDKDRVQKFESFAICPKFHWIAVSTSHTKDEFLRRIYWLEVNINDEIIERARKVFTSDNNPRSVFKAMSFYGYINDYAIFYGIESIGDGTRWGFYYDGIDIRLFRDKKTDYHIDEVHKMVRLRNEIWSLDYQGNLVKCKLTM